MYTLAIHLKINNLDFLINIITRPNGNENNNVKKNIDSVASTPLDNSFRTLGSFSLNVCLLKETS